MKRVLHVLYSLERSGMETMLLSSAAEWARHGLECDILATAPTPGPLAQAMRDAGYTVKHIPFRSPRFHYLPSWSLLPDFFLLCRQYDIVHIHVEGGATVYAMLARLAGVPRLARSVHNTFLFEGGLRARKRLTRRIARWLGVRFGMVSDSVMLCEQERFGNSGVRTWNWIDVDYFRPPSALERQAARERLGCGERFVVVSVGNCNTVKNHTALLQALVPMKRDRDVTYFHVGREQTGRPEYKLASSLDLEMETRFEGSQDPRQYFWAADAYVMCSIYEGLGVAAVEAVASGAPTVLSKVSGLCEILEIAQHAVGVETTPESIHGGLTTLAARTAVERRGQALEDSARVRELFAARRGVDIMVGELYGIDEIQGVRARDDDGPMKIAMCAPVDLKNLARFCRQDSEAVPPGLGSTATTPLIIELLKRGHEISLYTLSNELPEEMNFDWGALRVYVGKARTFGSARNFFYPEIVQLRRAIQKDNPAFIHAHWTYEFALGALGSGVPTLTTIHDLPWRVLYNFRDRFRLIRLLMAYAVAVRGSRYTAVSTDAALHFSRYMRPGAKVAMIPNFVEDKILALGEGPARPVREMLICATVLQGWSRRKNAKAALLAFKSVHSARPHTRLWMMGSDFQEDGPAHLWARENGVADGVEFLGLLPYKELLVLLREQVDILVHPSLDEAFSMTIAEGMALSLPIVAGCDTPGVMQALAGGKAGMVVDVRKPEEIAAAVLRLVDEPVLREHLGSRARDRVTACYSAGAVVGQYERVYREMGAVLAGKRCAEGAADAVK